MSLLDVFEKACPYYLVYGMTYEQFWDGDVRAHKCYREAYRIRKTEENTKLWLQGKYFYDALCQVSPIIRAFSKAKRPIEYTKQPYDLDAEDKRRREEREQKKKYDRMREKVALFAAEFNKMRHENEGKEVSADG